MGNQDFYLNLKVQDRNVKPISKKNFRLDLKRQYGITGMVTEKFPNVSE